VLLEGLQDKKNADTIHGDEQKSRNLSLSARMKRAQRPRSTPALMEAVSENYTQEQNEDPEQIVANAVWEACSAIMRAFSVPEILLFATTKNLHNGSLHFARQNHPAVSRVIVPAL
jgi:hypothetical protein